MPGRSARTVTPTAWVGLALDAATCSAYGVAPIAASTSGSANAANPSIRSDPGERDGRAPLVDPPAQRHAVQRPAGAVDRLQEGSGFLRVGEVVAELDLQPAVGRVGRAGDRPAGGLGVVEPEVLGEARCLARRRRHRRSAVTVILPVPSASIEMSTVVSTWHAASNITAITMRPRRIVSRLWHAEPGGHRRCQVQATRRP